MTIEQISALDKIKSLPDNSQDIIFADPPYALGSTVFIDSDGKPKYKEAKDFMNKWDMPDHNFWEEFFKQANRVLKYGGRCILFGIDRQLMLFQYYATFGGLQTNQSMYWTFACNDVETEILSNRGWLKYNQITKNDKVLTFNPKTELSEWQSVNDIFVYNVSNIDMVRIKNKDIDQKVTGNHRLLLKHKTNSRYEFSEWGYKEAKDLLRLKSNLVRFPMSAKNVENDIGEINQDYYHFLGWVFTDGYYQQGDNSIRISQSSTNIEKVNIIRDLLTRLGYDFKEYKRNRIYEYKETKKEYIEHVFYVNNDISKNIKNLYPNKRPDYELLNLHSENRYWLWVGMLGGDGGYNLSNGNRLTSIYETFDIDTVSYNLTKNIETCDFFNALSVSLGYKTIQNNMSSKSVVYVNCRKNTSGTQMKLGKEVTTEKYSGDVWSISTNNTNYCIRRNGRVSFTGNSSFPKATDVSKILDKRLGNEREVVGTRNDFALDGAVRNGNNHKNHKESAKESSSHEYGYKANSTWDVEVTKSTSKLGSKYEGTKYSISPLKQVLETLMVFQKPTKNKSTLDDILAYEDGDNEISPSIWNIDGSRVPTNQELGRLQKDGPLPSKYGFNDNSMGDKFQEGSPLGRYPSQLFISEEMGEILDKQSGVLKSGARKTEYTRRDKNPNETYDKFNEIQMDDTESDEGGMSRFFHNIGYLDEEVDLLLYSSKVSGSERNYGLNDKLKNNHPTLKPIKLIYRIAQLLKSPNPQKVFFPFSGSGSEIIGFISAGFDKELFTACELSQEYINIAHKRIEAWEKVDFDTYFTSKKIVTKPNTKQEDIDEWT